LSATFVVSTAASGPTTAQMYLVIDGNDAAGAAAVDPVVVLVTGNANRNGNGNANRTTREVVQGRERG
jgi:hypothetical protein